LFSSSFLPPNQTSNIFLNLSPVCWKFNFSSTYFIPLLSTCSATAFAVS
jgi:hypothetical protein